MITTNDVVFYALVYIACSFILMLFVGCSTMAETKAPCNYAGTFCGTKIAINH